MSFLYTVIGWPLGWVMWFCYLIVRNYGVALILFTFITRAIMFPLSIRQQKSTVKMASLKPKQDALQKRYGTDKQKYNEELMKLYKEEGYSPMSGCLPMLLQFPILFGLINVIYNPLKYILRIPSDIIAKGIEIAKALPDAAFKSATLDQINFAKALAENPNAFGELNNMQAGVVAKIQSLHLTFLGLNLTAVPTVAFNVLIIIPIFAGLMSFLLSIQSMRYNPAMSDKQTGGTMKMTMYIMPLFSVFISFSVPAGVGFYWGLSSLFMLLQAFILNKMYNPKEMAEKARLELESKKENERFERIEAKKQARERDKEQEKEKKQQLEDKYRSQKDVARQKLAEARRRDAEKYGEEYVDVTDEDLR